MTVSQLLGGIPVVSLRFPWRSSRLVDGFVSLSWTILKHITAVLPWGTRGIPVDEARSWFFSSTPDPSGAPLKDYYSLYWGLLFLIITIKDYCHINITFYTDLIWLDWILRCSHNHWGVKPLSLQDDFDRLQLMSHHNKKWTTNQRAINGVSTGHQRGVNGPSTGTTRYGTAWLQQRHVASVHCQAGHDTNFFHELRKVHLGTTSMTTRAR